MRDKVSIKSLFSFNFLHVIVLDKDVTQINDTVKYLTLLTSVMNASYKLNPACFLHASVVAHMIETFQDFN